MNELFSLRRLGLLLRTDLVSRYRLVRVTSITIAILMIAQGTIAANFVQEGSSVSPGWLMFMLFILGPIVASGAFKELHDKTRNEAYLLLPASTLEKTIARLLMITVIYVGYVFIFVFAVSFLNIVFNFVLFGRKVGFVSVHQFEWYSLLGNLLVIQSVFFLGAAWFRKTHFIKTLLTIALIFFCLFTLGILLLRIGFGGHFLNTHTLHIGDLIEKADFKFLGFIASLRHVVYFGALPVFCWWVAWLRVKETQVSHGV